MYIAESTDTPCQQTDPQIWFAKQNTRDTRLAKRLCYKCDERIKCLNSIVKFEQKFGTQPGIYGGMDPVDRSVFLGLPATATA